METFFILCYNTIAILCYCSHITIPRGVSHIEFEVDDNKKVHNVRFIGGCSGNTQGVASLVEGMDAEEVISRLKGIKCGFKNTSCPDQLSTALEEVLNK